jgi:hypothetical protein
MSVYRKNGNRIHAYFDQSRNDQFDLKGKNFVKNIFSKLGFLTIDYDKDADGNHVWQNTDLLIKSPKGTVYRIEPEIKRERIFGYTKDGVDIPLRKEKYAYASIRTKFFIINENLREFIIVDDVKIKMAVDACGEEYEGYGSLSNSKNYVLPEHGCRRVRKLCRKKDSQRHYDDFVRIPLSQAKHYKLNSLGLWQLCLS